MDDPIVIGAEPIQVTAAQAQANRQWIETGTVPIGFVEQEHGGSASNSHGKSTMKTNGYKLRDALKYQVMRRDAATQEFNSSLKIFPGEQKDTPQQIVQELLLSEKAISELQVAQIRYNLAVIVNVLGESMTLADAIKRVGGIARAEKLWRTVTPEKRGLWDDEIDPSKTRSEPTISPKEALKLAQGAAKHSGAFRAAIAAGNGQELEITDLDPGLFE